MTDKKSRSTSSEPAPSARSPGSQAVGPSSLEADLARVYAELRRHAQTLLAGERSTHTLEATALVHEALCKLLAEAGGQAIPLPPEQAVVERRKVLFTMLSTRMRQVLVEYSRHRNALKGPGAWARSPLHEAMAKIDHEGLDVLELDRALSELQRIDADVAVVFQHRWFGGLSMKHVASILEITPGEAQRRWTLARKFMRGLLDEQERS